MLNKTMVYLILVAVTAIAGSVLVYNFYQAQLESKNLGWDDSFVSHQVIRAAASAAKADFTFDCPKGWKTEDNLDYDGKVKTKQCVLDNNKPGSVSFDDGVIVSFKFISNSVVESEKEYFNNLMESRTTNYNDSKDYSNNNFVGKIARDPYDISLIARIKTNDGYYEVEAWSLVSEQTKNDQENRKATIDQIISSFKIIK